MFIKEKNILKCFKKQNNTTQGTYERWRESFFYLSVPVSLKQFINKLKLFYKKKNCKNIQANNLSKDLLETRIKGKY